MTKADNLRKVLRGESPAWIPFSLNFCQWFGQHQAQGKLPPELRDCQDYIDALIAFDCDVFTRNVDGGTRCEDTQILPKIDKAEMPLGTRTTHTYETPHGTLTQVDQQQRLMHTSHREKCFAEDYENDFEALMWLEEQKSYDWDSAVFEQLADRVGDHGLINIPVYCTPLKQLHWSIGLEGACYMAMEDEAAADAYCELYWSKVRPVLEKLAAHPRVASIIFVDNVDTPFYPPAMCEHYWTPYVKETVELFEPLGKTVWVHACGQLKGLSGEFCKAGVNGLEGIAHPTLGDWWVDEAQACHERFIFNGGYSAMEQEIADRGELERFYDDFFARAGRERFIFSSSCNTAIQTPWERLLWLKEIVRERGGSPAQPLN